MGSFQDYEGSQNSGKKVRDSPKVKKMLEDIRKIDSNIDQELTRAIDLQEKLLEQEEEFQRKKERLA